MSVSFIAGLICIIEFFADYQTESIVQDLLSVWEGCIVARLKLILKGMIQWFV